MRKLISILGFAGLVSSLALATAVGAGTKNHGSSTTPCGDNGTIVTSPTALWPPNHKDVPISFTYTDPDGGDVTLETTANPHNEVVGGEEINGTGNTPAATDSVGGAGSDSDGSVTVVGSARAERSGHKNVDGGRVYEFDYVAMNDSNGIPPSDDGCMSDPGTVGDGIIVFVPHDCRGGACKG